jgi:hypothetical protein
VNKPSKSNKNNNVPLASMSYDMFKKNFFPQYCYVDEDNQSEGENRDKKLKEQLIAFPVAQPGVIELRIKQLEEKLKKKFGGQYRSVREAFLALDSNYDGVVDAEDILKQFSNEDKIDYTDLHKLMKDKDSNHVGELNYTDFSKWLGCAVHQISGFYFRHDSVKNPPFELHE